jgi:hypothetical protein
LWYLPCAVINVETVSCQLSLNSAAFNSGILPASTSFLVFANCADVCLNLHFAYIDLFNASNACKYAAATFRETSFFILSTAAWDASASYLFPADRILLAEEVKEINVRLKV